MPAIDFISALGRLLRDGALRDAFAADRRTVVAQLNVQERDEAALLQLVPDDLEFQGRVLLNKRFDVARKILPETCSRLGIAAGSAFHQYARGFWPSSGDIAATDALEFCRFLKSRHSHCLCEAECNRVRFVQSKRTLSVHFVNRPSVKGSFGKALQVLLRGPSGRRHEVVLYAKL